MCVNLGVSSKMVIDQLEIRVSGQSQGPCAAKDVTIETLVITLSLFWTKPSRICSCRKWICKYGKLERWKINSTAKFSAFGIFFETRNSQFSTSTNLVRPTKIRSRTRRERSTSTVPIWARRRPRRDSRLVNSARYFFVCFFLEI